MKKYIYGIDVSLSETGVVIYDEENKEIIKLFTIPTTINKKTGLSENPNSKNSNMIMGIKLKHIYDTLIKYKEKYPPKLVVIERGFSRFNKSTQTSFRVHGIINLLFYNVENIYYSPKEIKEAITGKGNAKKEEVCNKINKLMGTNITNHNESDAIGILLTHLYNKK